MEEKDVDKWYEEEIKKISKSFQDIIKKKKERLPVEQEYKKNLQKLRKEYLSTSEKIIKKPEKKKKAKKKEAKKEEKQKIAFVYKHPRISLEKQRLANIFALKKLRYQIQEKNTLDKLHLSYPLLLVKRVKRHTFAHVQEMYSIVKEGIGNDANAIKERYQSMKKTTLSKIKKTSEKVFKLLSKGYSLVHKKKKTEEEGET